MRHASTANCSSLGLASLRPDLSFQYTQWSRRALSSPHATMAARRRRSGAAARMSSPQAPAAGACRGVSGLLQHERVPRPPLLRPGASARAAADQGFPHRARLALPRFRSRRRRHYAVPLAISRGPAATDLDRWDTFEAEHPAMFGRMYQFWVQKAGPGTSHSGQTVSARPLAPSSTRDQPQRVAASATW